MKINKAGGGISGGVTGLGSIYGYVKETVVDTEATSCIWIYS